MGIFRKNASHQAGPVIVVDVVEQPRQVPAHQQYRQPLEHHHHHHGPVQSSSANHSSQHRPAAQHPRYFNHGPSNVTPDRAASMDAARPSLSSSHSGHSLSQFSASPSATVYPNHVAQQSHLQMHPNGSRGPLQYTSSPTSTSSLSVPSSLTQVRSHSTPPFEVQHQNSRDASTSSSAPHQKKPSMLKSLVKKKHSMPELREKAIDDKKRSSKKKFNNAKLSVTDEPVPPLPVIQLQLDVAVNGNANHSQKSDNIARFSINSMLNSVALRLDEHDEQEEHRKKQEQARLRAEYMRRADLMSPEQRQIGSHQPRSPMHSATSSAVAVGSAEPQSTQQQSSRPARLAPTAPSGTNPRISSPHYGALTHPTAAKPRMPVQNPSHVRQRSMSQPTLSLYARHAAMPAAGSPAGSLRPPKQYDESFFSTPRKSPSSDMLSAAHPRAYLFHSTQSRTAPTAPANTAAAIRQNTNRSPSPAAEPLQMRETRAHRPEMRPSPASFVRNQVYHPGHGDTIRSHKALQVIAATPDTPNFRHEHTLETHGGPVFVPAAAQYATPPCTSSRTDPAGSLSPKFVAGHRPPPLNLSPPAQRHAEQHLLSTSVASSRQRANSDSSVLDPFVETALQVAPTPSPQQRSPAPSFAALVAGPPSSSGPPPRSPLPALPQPQPATYASSAGGRQRITSFGHERSPSLRHRARFQHEGPRTPQQVAQMAYQTPKTNGSQSASTNSSASRSGTASSRPSLSVSGSMSSCDAVDPDTSLSICADDTDSVEQISPELNNEEWHARPDGALHKWSPLNKPNFDPKIEQRPAQWAPRSFPLLERHGIKVRQYGL